MLDRVNDPETRHGLPMTWGICRTNVRRVLSVGDHLFFVGHIKADPTGIRYYLTAHLKVGELIGHDEAFERFGQRKGNVVIEPAPPGVQGKTVQLPRGQYMHACWDHHQDWEHRINIPYVVGDPDDTQALRPGIPYPRVAAECGLVPADDLQNKYGIHPQRRIRSVESVECLLKLVRHHPE